MAWELVYELLGSSDSVSIEKMQLKLRRKGLRAYFELTNYKIVNLPEHLMSPYISVTH